MNLFLRRTGGLLHKFINPALPLRCTFREECMLCSHSALQASCSVRHICIEVEALPSRRHHHMTLSRVSSASTSASIRHVRIASKEPMCIRHVHTTTSQSSAVSKLKEASADSSDDMDSPKPVENNVSNNLPESAPSAEIVQLVKEIANLSLLEASDLSYLLKKKLGLSDSGMPYYGGGMGPVPTSGAAAPAAEEEKKPEKMNFDVMLEKFDAAAKIKVIKEVRTFTSLGLKEAKELVEKLPAVLKKGVAKEEAEMLIEKLKAVGAMAVLE